MIFRQLGGALLSLMLLAAPAVAQLTVLDQTQDNVGVALPPPPPVCGTQPLAIARMNWPSAALLAEIHARILAAQFGCDIKVIPGDLAATGSSMGSTGQPAVAPEMWINRIAELWNPAIEAQMVRPAAPSYAEANFEGWFIPDYVAAAHSELTSAAALATTLPTLNGGTKVRFVSCPPDWACALINRNLVRAYGLGNLVDIVEPANRFEMDTLIGEAVSRQEAIVFYYWQPNAVLAQFGFRPLDMGPYNEANAKCLASLSCPSPAPSAFAPETVVTALAEWVFTDIPTIAGYFQRSSLPLAEMNGLLAQLNLPGATIEGVADRFVAERGDLWRQWVGNDAP